MKLKRNDAEFINGCSHDYSDLGYWILGFGSVLTLVTGLVAIGVGWSFGDFLWTDQIEFNLLRFSGWSAVVITAFGLIKSTAFERKLRFWRNEVISTDDLAQLTVLLSEIEPQTVALPSLPEAPLGCLTNDELSRWARSADSILKETERSRMVACASK